MRQQRNFHRGRLWPVRHHHILGQRRKHGILEPFDRFAKLPLAAVLLDFGILELAIVLRQNARNRAVTVFNLRNVNLLRVFVDVIDIGAFTSSNSNNAYFKIF